MADTELLSGKLLYEFRTMQAMVEIYCKAHHPLKPSQGVCLQCSEFLSYANTRLDRCPYGQDKPTCNKCPVHCYKPHMKQRARECCYLIQFLPLSIYWQNANRHQACRQKEFQTDIYVK